MPFHKHIFKKGISAVAFILFYLSAQGQINCDNDTTYLIPIVDLQTGFYLGKQGGLYPGGSNEIPAAHATAGLAIAEAIQPVNFIGQNDTVVGKLVMLALGPLDAGKSFNKFLVDYDAAGYSDTCFKIVNGCFESFGLDEMTGALSDELYWSEVNGKLQEHNVKRKQVQIVWLMSTSFADTIIDFNSYVDSLKDQYVNSIRRIKNEFVNLKLLYISGLHYGGYSSTTAEHAPMLNEPAPYYNDFAIKSLIEDQINGDTLLSYTDSICPWMAWGPNFWADGRNERVYDNLKWLCPGDFDTGEDGYMLDGTGQQKIADALMQFFTTQPTTTPWIYGLNYPCYEDTTAEEEEVSYPEDEVVWIIQNPVNEVLKFTINIASAEKAEVAVYNIAGQQIQEGSFYKIEPGKTFTIKLPGHGRGIYILSVLVEGKVYNVPFYLDT